MRSFIDGAIINHLIPYLHEVVQRVKVGHPLVTQDEEFVVSFLEDSHPLAVDLELLTMELDLCLATLLNISLELVDDFVFFLMLVIFNFDTLHVRAEFSLFQLFLKGKILVNFMVRILTIFNCCHQKW